MSVCKRSGPRGAKSSSSGRRVAAGSSGRLQPIGLIVCLTFGCNAVLAGCTGGDTVKLTVAELQDPETCNECHTAHFQEWSGSMHAYASTDPVFRAMNRRGQEETGGALGSFCVNCHAPLALRLGLTQDGLNLDEVPAHLQGITCYFCHNIQDVAGDHNNPIELAMDTTMRGGIRDPAPSQAHEAAYSAWMDSRQPDSAKACGSCHDIVLPSPPAPAAVELERTFKEWRGSIFTKTGLTCSVCHMDQARTPTPIAEAPGVKVRPGYPHSHAFPGVDVALEPFPEQQQQRMLIERELDSTLRVVRICLTRLRKIFVELENQAAGHRWPSGASQDRRAWVEVIAYAKGQVIWQTGVVQEGQSVTSLSDPDLWLFRDEALGADGKEVHMFWEVAEIREHTIAAPITADQTLPEFFNNHALRTFPSMGVLPERPDLVTARVRMRPMGLEVLDDLIASGHLDPSIRAAMPTYDLLPRRERGSLVTAQWTPELAADPATGRMDKIDMIPAECVVRQP
ncbi:MAG: hypothetical protein MJD61_23015 [Proteobacteria bacterium]|nr:hypothetical protein [Pseudomonadota bacterium]